MAKKAKEIPDIMDFNYTELTALCEHLENKENAGLRFKTRGRQIPSPCFLIH